MTSKSKKILEEIHPLHIIRAVEKWPALYAKDSPERTNPHFRLKIWCEVAKELFPDWNTYTKTEKDKKLTDLNKKWRSLRDMYKRQVEVERKIREGHDIKKKTYVYYNHLSFLRPHIADSDLDEAPLPPPKRKKLRPDAPLDSLAAPAPSASVFVEEIDEDKHFLMSLIPSFKKMTEDEKLTAKMEILKAIKGVRSGNAASYQVVDTLAYNTEPEVIRDESDIKREFFTDMEPVNVIFEEQRNSDG